MKSFSTTLVQIEVVLAWTFLNVKTNNGRSNSWLGINTNSLKPVSNINEFALFLKGLDMCLPLSDTRQTFRHHILGAESGSGFTDGKN